MSLPAVSPAVPFDQAARVVLAYVREHVPMGFWSVTRVENGRQTYLYLDDNAYGLQRGGSHPWEDSFCVHMAAGTAPAVAPVAQDVPLYVAARVGQAVPIGAYAGAAITEPDGALFGALCGIHPQDRRDDEGLAAAGPLLALLGQLLSLVLASERATEHLAAEVSRAELAAETDALTGLRNRRAWDRMLAEEEERFARFGDPTVVMIVDLDRLKQVNDEQGHAVGDDYIQRAADALRGVFRADDAVCRLGGDEFGVLLRRCDESTARRRVADVYRAQEAAGVAGSVGWAPITVLKGFPAALAEADAAMYAAKLRRRAVRAGGDGAVRAGGDGAVRAGGDGAVRAGGDGAVRPATPRTRPPVR